MQTPNCSRKWFDYLLIIISPLYLFYKVDGNLIESSFAKATTLNNFFYKCFNKKQPPLSDFYPDVHVSLHPSNCPNDFLCTEKSVLELLMDMNTNKSTGLDGISPKMLKCTSICIVLSFSMYHFQQVSFLMHGNCAELPQYLRVQTLTYHQTIDLYLSSRLLAS